MADFLNIPFDLSSVSSMAAQNSMEFWINIVIGMVLSTVIGGVLLIVVLLIFNRIYGEMLDYKRAFLVVFLVNLITYVGLIGFLNSILGGIPYIGIILPLLVWIVLLKVFFEDMSFLHTIIVGVVFYIVTVPIILYLVDMITVLMGL